MRVSFLILTTAALLASVLANPTMAQSGDPIQPGDDVTHDGALCTLNFVFDGVGPLAGKTFIGSAAHCFNGKTGGPVSSTNNPDFGTVFYVGDYPDTANGGEAVENGIPGAQADFALIEVHPKYVDHVQPQVLGHADTPTGVASHTETAPGDLLLLSGHGTGFGFTDVTRESRVGVLYSQSETEYVAQAPITPGDSGGPVVHESGDALGVVSGIQVGVSFNDVGSPLVKWYGPTLEHILQELDDIGYPVTLRTA